MLRNAPTPDLLELLDAGSPGDIDFYSQYARHAGGPVLNLLCGTGRIAIAIARQGIPVIGLDSDGAAIEQAKRKAAQAGVTRAAFVQGSSADFVSEGKHPVVIIPAGGLQRILTSDEQRACFLAIRRVLGLGGKVVMDLPLLDPGTIQANQPVLRRIGDRSAVLQVDRRFDAARQVVDELICCQFLDQAGLVEKSQYAVCQARYTTPGEVALLLEVCGFTSVCYGGFDRQPLLPGATRLVVESERNR